MRTRLSALAVASLLFASPAIASELEWQTETSFNEWSTLGPECDNDCPDTVAYYVQSIATGVNLYMTYYEGTRIAVGFGSVRNEVLTLPADAIHPGGYDWGGKTQNGQFKASYVIKRYYGADENFGVDRNKSVLVVFRLKDDGTSCMINTGGQETADNVTARNWAEADSKNPKCSD
jgi:hypothetical protein